MEKVHRPIVKEFTEAEWDHLLNAHDILRDIWNRRYLHGADDGEKDLVKDRVKKLFDCGEWDDV